MAQPKSQTDFDPNRTPFTAPAARFTYWTHPLVGKLMIHSDTKVVTPIPGGPMYPQFPLKIPAELMAVDQPHIRTCGNPTSGNKGCTAAAGGGCPIVTQYGRVGPCNVIIEKNGNVDSVPCYSAYCGVSPHGRPTSQVHYLQDGWNILTDRTTIPQNMRDHETKRETIRYVEVPDLAPFYDHLKQPEPAKRKRGRPRKELVSVADREDRPTA